MRGWLVAGALFEVVSWAQVPPVPEAVLVAGAARPSPSHATDVAISPQAIAVGTDGTLAIADSNRLWVVSPAGDIRSIAGPWSGSEVIRSLALDTGGNLYVADYYTVWKMLGTGQIVRVAGGGNLSPSGQAASPATGDSGSNNRQFFHIHAHQCQEVRTGIGEESRSDTSTPIALSF